VWSRQSSDPLLIVEGWKFVAQRGQPPVQVGGDGSAGHAEYLGGGGVQVKQDPQGDDLALPEWQPPQSRK